jgi:Zn-dependent protease with chaperone function
MTNRVWLFGIILAIPLIGFGVAEGIRAYVNSQLRSAIYQNYPNADRNAVSKVSIDDLCDNSRFQNEQFCSTNMNLNLMSRGALSATAVGLILLLLIKVAGSAARRSRLVLLYLLKPGLYLTVVALIGLVIVYAAIAMGAIYYGESMLFNRVHVFIIGAIGLGALAGIGAMAKSALTIVRKAQALVVGKSIPRSQNPQLWEHVDLIAEKVGSLRPEHIVVGLDPNFFVTEAEVVCLDGNVSGRTLYCSLPLCRILSTEEVSAVIGHELGHFKGLDTSFSQRFYPIYRGTVTSLVNLHQAGGEGAMIIALLPAIAILSYFLECFSIAESRIGRARELEADHQGAAIASPRSMASALVKIHAFSGLWVELQAAVVKALEQGNYFVNASKTYAEAALACASPTILDGIAETHLSHPTDSHPPLADRLEALTINIEDVADLALQVQPNQPAIQLLTNPDQIEEEISGAYQAIIARTHNIEMKSNYDDMQEVRPTNTLSCEHCGSAYDIEDYNRDASKWFCRQCGRELPRW